MDETSKDKSKSKSKSGSITAPIVIGIVLEVLAFILKIVLIIVLVAISTTDDHHGVTVRQYSVGDLYETTFYTLKVKNDTENERFVFTYRMTDAYDERMENAEESEKIYIDFAFRFEYDDASRSWEKYNNTAFTYTTEAGDALTFESTWSNYSDYIVQRFYKIYVFTGDIKIYVSYAGADEEVKTAIKEGTYKVGDTHKQFGGKAENSKADNTQTEDSATE